MSPWLRCALVFLLALCAGVPAAGAQAVGNGQHAAAGARTSASAREQASALTARAAIAYRAGRFDNAAGSYARAYELVPAPELLFNLGQCYRQLNRGDEAQAAFGEYLRARPDAPERAQIERWIAARPASMTTDVAPPQASAHARAAAVDRSLVATQPNARREEATGLYERWWFWTAVGALAVGGGITAALLLTGDDEPAPTGSLGTVRWN